MRSFSKEKGRFDGGYFVTVSVTVAVLNSEPVVPVIRMVNVPIAGLLLTVRVSVEVPVPGIVLMVKLAVTPVGSPETLRRTGCANPFKDATVMLMLAEFPLRIESEVGVIESEKSVT